MPIKHIAMDHLIAVETPPSVGTHQITEWKVYRHKIESAFLLGTITPSKETMGLFKPEFESNELSSAMGRLTYKDLLALTRLVSLCGNAL